MHFGLLLQQFITFGAVPAQLPHFLLQPYHFVGYFGSSQLAEFAGSFALLEKLLLANVVEADRPHQGTLGLYDSDPEDVGLDCLPLSVD